MNLRSKSRALPALLLAAALGAAPAGQADDIDIFIGSSGQSADAPNVMILLANSPNWSRASQKWPDQATQGQAEVDAIAQVLATITQPVNLGLAEFGGGGLNGAYVRFGARDVSVAANRSALSDILDHIYHNINSPSEKINGTSSEDDSAAFYELYKYYAGLPPYAGAPAQNTLADTAGNRSTYTGAGQGLSTGFGYTSSGDYNTPSTTAKPCAKNYIIFIANNMQGGGLPDGEHQYENPGADAGAALTPTISDFWTDEWARFNYQHGIVTYVLDAFNKQQNQGYSDSLRNAAKMGGGDYTQVGSEQAIIDTLKRIFIEIQAVNTTFASASLPVNTSNRTQDQNQVFFSVFRPDPDAKPRWFGNMKRYQLIQSGNNVDLGDANGAAAINTQTGFLADCALSFWTTDSASYWQNYLLNPVPAGQCSTSANNKFSDAPDGPFIEKGSTAEVLRKGNNPPGTNSTPTYAVNRTVYTLAGTSTTLSAFNAASSGLAQSLVNFVLGQDANDENGDGDLTETRASIHGDVIHSRPLPVNYSNAANDTVYYGANDGMLRAVNTANGKERWAFVAPEFFSRLSRLQTDSPLVAYPGLPAGLTPAPTRKDYFFDGSIGLYQNADNSKVWIYPSMRRGGRMIYAFDVTDPNNPVFKWKAGCPHLGDDFGCSFGMSGIGQTFSTPSLAFVKGYSTTTPVVIVGGGYDACEDSNSALPLCLFPKGAAVYVLDAASGALLKTFPTTRSVAADVATLDLDNDGFVDYAYAADTGGNIYRMDFVASPVAATPLAPILWNSHTAAYTFGAGRKFLFGPALLANSNHVYLALASGDREHPLQSQYPYSTPVLNRFYVYVDDLSTATLGNLDSSLTILNRSSGADCNSSKVLPGSTSSGWFMNLNQNGTGEQGVTGAVIAGGLVTFNTNRPIAASTGSCATVLGEARGYLLNLLSGAGAIGVGGSCGGTPSAAFVQGGLPPTPVLATVPINGVLQTVLVGAIRKDGSVSTTISPEMLTPPVSTKRRRIYWKKSGDAN